MKADIPTLIDDFEGDLARRGRARRTRTSYRWTLWKFADAHPDLDPAEITRRHCERFLNRWANLEPATMAQREAALAGFTRYLHRQGVLAQDPMRDVERTKRKRPEQLDVVAVSTEDVRRMFEHVQTWGEALCLFLLAYTGARRGAVSSLRWRHVDLAGGEIRYAWKGGGIHVLRISDDLRELLIAAVADHSLDTTPDAYVVPNLRPAGVSREERDDRIVWTLVRRVAGRAGVRAHVHSLRAAFAVFCLDEAGVDVLALRDIMGHERVETTLVYLRRRDRRRSIDQLQGLSWGAARYEQEQSQRIRDSNPCSEQEPSPSASDENAAGNALIDNPVFRRLLDRLRESDRERRR